MAKLSCAGIAKQNAVNKVVARCGAGIAVETNQVSSTLQTLNLQLIKWIPLEGRSIRTSQSNKS
jgi:hypothetical protein